MRLKNHIALRFLTDEKFIMDMIEEHLGGKKLGITSRPLIEKYGFPKIASLWRLLSKDHQKAYMVTETVHDKLDMLKVKKDSEGHYDWTVFKNIMPCKKTFILYPVPEWKGGGCLRLLVEGNKLEFCHLCFRFNPGSKEEGEAKWTMFYIDRISNEHAEHCAHPDVQAIYEFVYKLMCFVFLSENEYEVLNPGASKGTQKTGKIKNELPVPITIINSKWNITSIRSEGFLVRGHFALRRCGVGYSYTRMVYIEPFEKHGYVRHAKNEEIK